MSPLEFIRLRPTWSIPGKRRKWNEPWVVPVSLGLPVSICVTLELGTIRSQSIVTDGG